VTQSKAHAARPIGGAPHAGYTARPMALLNLSSLVASLAPGQRLLGLDPGAKTIGLALSDVTLRIASPLRAIPRRKLSQTATEIAAIARERGVGGLVVGLPLAMDGRLGRAAQAARDWAEALATATLLPTALWDERLSTAAVNRMLVEEADLSRKRRSALVDAAAAAWILQTALDCLRPDRPPAR